MEGQLEIISVAVEEVAVWIVDVVELEEEACIRLIIHVELVLMTLVMGYESRANHSRYFFLLECEFAF